MARPCGFCLQPTLTVHAVRGDTCFCSDACYGKQVSRDTETVRRLRAELDLRRRAR